MDGDEGGGDGGDSAKASLLRDRASERVGISWRGSSGRSIGISVMSGLSCLRAGISGFVDRGGNSSGRSRLGMEVISSPYGISGVSMPRLFWRSIGGGVVAFAIGR